MNTRKLNLMTILVVIGLFIGINLSKAEASAFLGDFCWQASSTMTPKSVLLRIGVAEMGGGHFALYGKVFQGNNTAMHGNAEIDGSNVLITLVESGDINSFWPGTEALLWNAVLNLATLNGTYSSLEVIPQQNVVEDEGTMTLITCP